MFLHHESFLHHFLLIITLFLSSCIIYETEIGGHTFPSSSIIQEPNKIVLSYPKEVTRLAGLSLFALLVRDRMTIQAISGLS